MTNITWNGREVHNPVLRVMVVVFTIAVSAIIVAIGVVALVVGLTLALPFHPLFRIFGKKGIYRGNGEFTFDKTSFERQR